MTTLIRSTPTHDYHSGPLGEISVPKLTRVCSVCGKPDVFNMDNVSFHKQHGGILVKIEVNA